MDIVREVTSVMRVEGGDGVTHESVRTHQWRGVIEEYRELLDIPAGVEAVTLREGGTPLVHSEWLSGLTGAEVWLKVEGDNPTGSFKDRGMTTAISVAKADGARGGRLRVHRQHVGLDGGVRRARPASPRSCSCPRARSRPARWRRRSCTARA